MKQHVNGYVGNRVLKLNVGFLLAGGPGHSHETVFDVPAIRVSDDVDLEYIRGPLRLSRTKEGILVQGTLHVGVDDECYRCLDPIERDVIVDVEELFAYPPSLVVEFSLTDDGVLDLAPLVREETLIATSTGTLCKPDCQGLCPDCGANWNHTRCDCQHEKIDPRLATLKALLDAKK